MRIFISHHKEHYLSRKASLLGSSQEDDLLVKNRDEERHSGELSSDEKKHILTSTKTKLKCHTPFSG